MGHIEHARLDWPSRCNPPATGVRSRVQRTVGESIGDNISQGRREFLEDPDVRGDAIEQIVQIISGDVPSVEVETEQPEEIHRRRLKRL